MANYTITVNFNDASGDNGYQSPNADTNKVAKEEQNQLNAVGSSIFNFAESGIKSFASIVTVAGVANIAKNIFSHEVQRIGRYTGSQQAQDVANASISLIGKLINPISALINLGYETDENMYQREWENIGLTLYRERGGISLNRSRTER